MNKKSNHFIAAVLICLSAICNFAKAQNVNIPDANFKAYLVGNSSVNTNLDGEIQTSEAVAYTGGIYAGTQSISNLTGIEAFINITGLDVSQNSLTTIDLSSNTALTNFYCYFNSITYLNLSTNTALTYVDCSDNQLTSLNIKNGNNTNLISFSAINNSGLTCILVDNAAYMNSIWPSAKDAGASYNDLCCTVNILDANFKASLVGNSAINTNLDGEIQCSEAAAFTGTIIVNSLSITDLTGIEAFTALTGLYCQLNQLTSLNLTANTNLTYLSCYDNQLTSLDISANTALGTLDCHINQLTSLDVSVNTALAQLDCSSNLLTSLNIQNGNNINFTYFDATINPSLSCIQVDDAAYMNTNWASGKDAGASYSNNCVCTTVVDAGTDQTVCSNMGYATLNGSVIGSTTTGNWQTLGDGNFSPNNTTLSVNYNFGPADIASGYANLFLTSTNNGACPAVIDSVVITIDVNSAFFGTVNYMGTFADSVNVVLYKINTDGSYQEYATIETDVAGYYQFDFLPDAKYVVKAEPSTIKYPNYLPTYFLSTSGTTYWDQAFIDSLYCGVNHNISLIQKVPQTGGWQCNGYIYEYFGFGARLAGNIQGIMAPGEPIPDIDITIDQSPGGTVSSATTDLNGYFSFTGLNNNVTFVVRVDLPGYPNDSVYTFTVTPGDPALDSLNFYIDSVGVYIIPEGIFTSVNLIALNEFNINISPNPTTQNFVLEITSTKHAIINVNLTNTLGELVLSNQSNLNIGLNKVNFDIQNQPPGVYFMAINYENNHFVKKIIKQ